jgi:dipeptidyl aminopeptidase/acylaminoacyl peptidase
MRVSDPQDIQVMTWAPDGRDLLVRKNLTTGGNEHEFWLVPVSDGQPRKVTSTPNIEGAFVRVHPDGRQIAFMTGSATVEIWMMENFLPQTATTRAAKK